MRYVTAMKLPLVRRYDINEVAEEFRNMVTVTRVLQSVDAGLRIAVDPNLYHRGNIPGLRLGRDVPGRTA